ncbi:hypothetical protein M0R89_20135 (plasmid) [Halorussus limi]|uniref:Uncharacterized protein n=1 Tax=Halorussus limi TaxID=2938695 RepID=A0A8U0I0C3_9EURY|nr:hypothetical protein [Halorussus limi]UPV76473.1 hypothetical protein M0R89_20135 [Halorussus limi]
MDRRQLLVAGAAFFAGCTGGEPDPATGDAETRTTTAGETTAAETSATTRTTTETETTTTETTETETERTTETKKPNENLVEARDALRTAFELYTSNAKSSDAEVSILDVNVASGGFPRSKMNVRLKEARDALGDAGETATDEEKRTISELRDVAQFLELASYVDLYLGRSYRHFRKLVSKLYEGEYRNAKIVREEMVEDRRKADDYRWKVGKKTDAASADATDLFTKSEYEKKVKQVQRSVGNVKTLESLAEKLVDGFERFSDANDRYDSGSYNDAASSYYRAGNLLEDVSDTLSNAGLVDPLSTKTERLTCVLDALVEATEHMEEAAEAQERVENADDADERRSARDDAQRAERDARDAAESCDEVSKTIAVVENLG